VAEVLLQAQVVLVVEVQEALVHLDIVAVQAETEEILVAVLFHRQV
jgi:hypothetical protein